jgi:nitric oxide reductase large subunit
MEKGKGKFGLSHQRNSAGLPFEIIRASDYKSSIYWLALGELKVIQPML